MEFSVILPAYNEAENLPPLLKGLKAVLANSGILYEIVVVDDGSSDNTREVLESLKKHIPELKIIAIEKNLGFGNGVLRGLEAAEGEVLGFMDSDRQIAPEYLLQAYQKLKNEKLDFCKAVRVKRFDSWPRLFLSKIYNLVFRMMFGGGFIDISAKPKVFTRQLYRDIRPASKDWFLDSEIVIKIIKLGCKSGEFPIVFESRAEGKSKVRASTAFEFIKNMIYWRFLSNNDY